MSSMRQYPGYKAIREASDDQLVEWYNDYLGFLGGASPGDQITHATGLVQLELGRRSAKQDAEFTKQSLLITKIVAAFIVVSVIVGAGSCYYQAKSTNCQCTTISK